VDKNFSFADFGKKVEEGPRAEKKPQDFSFFDDFLGTEKEKKVKDNQNAGKKVEVPVNQFFENFANFKEKDAKGKEKPALGASNSQKVLQ
jgi:hypothetical protein